LDGVLEIAEKKIKNVNSQKKKKEKGICTFNVKSIVNKIAGRVME
jgi:hypothetical protein